MPARTHSPSVRRVAVLIPAAGSGTRMANASAAAASHGGEAAVDVPAMPGAAPANKVLLPLGGETVLRHAVRAFMRSESVSTIRIVARKEDFGELERAFNDRESWPRLGAWVAGGAQRQDSVRHGLAALAQDPAGPPDWVLVHDGARPLCSAGLVQRVLKALERHPAVAPVVLPVDTVRRAGQASSAAAGGPGDGGVLSGGVEPRDALRLTQTPQGFHWPTLQDAHARAAADGFVGTDDAQLVERLGVAVALVPGERRNLKITLPDDLTLAEWILKHPGWGISP